MIFSIKWSAAKINSKGSLPEEIAWRAATAIAGAVLRPTGSKIIAWGLVFISLNCSATINLCSSLHINMGFFRPSKPRILS